MEGRWRAFGMGSGLGRVGLFSTEEGREGVTEGEEGWFEGGWVCGWLGWLRLRLTVVLGMEDFAALEAKFRRTPVRLLDHDGVSGVLRLRGRKSLLSLTSEKFIQFQQSDENGWFDVRVKAPDGREILLHHAFNSGTSEHYLRGTSVYSASIFPNIVIDDIKGISEDHKIQRIRFRFRGMRNFFYYRHTEALRGYPLSTALIDEIRAVRHPTSQDDGIFAPRELYIVHDFPIFLDFKIDDRAYQVWAGGRSAGGYSARIDARTYPICSITFDSPVSIAVALDRVWEWHRFFIEMAMQPLPFKTVSVEGSTDYDTPSANVYFPNLKQRVRIKNEVSPRYVPLNFWRDRERLGGAMQNWLSRNAMRKGFRGRLARVIDRISQRIDPTDLVELGSAVDSLDELKMPASLLPREVLNAMADAAHSAAVAAGAAIDHGRVRDLLGAIQRPSLSKRFMALGAAVSPPVIENDIRILANSAAQIRNDSAHGRDLNAQTQPRLYPTVQALTALCVRFDLQTCGVPIRSSADAPSIMQQRFEDGMEQLRQLQAHR